MPKAQEPILRSCVERGVLILTIAQARIEGEEVAQRLREEMLAEVARTGAKRVVIDLQHARYLSSISFWPLLSLRRQLLDTGGRLLICGLSGDVEDVFMTTRMISRGGAIDAPFEVAADWSEAVARLASE